MSRSFSLSGFESSPVSRQAKPFAERLDARLVSVNAIPRDRAFDRFGHWAPRAVGTDQQRLSDD